MHLEGGSLSLQAVGSIKRKNKSHRRQHSNNEVSSIHHTLGQPTNRIKETTDGSPVWIGKSLSCFLQNNNCLHCSINKLWKDNRDILVF